MRPLLRRLLADLSDVEEPGSFVAVTLTTIRNALLAAGSVWQLVVVAALLIGPHSGAATGWLIAAHLLTALAMNLARHGRLPAWLPIAAAYALFLGDWGLSTSLEDPLLFASCWMVNLNNTIPAFAMRGRLAAVLPLTAAVALPTAMILARPDLGPDLPGAVLVTVCAMVLVTRIGRSSLVVFARSADATVAAKAREHEALMTQRGAARAAAEDARVLHDTVINTLGALAGGGRATSDLPVVRARCADDVETVRALVTGRAAALDRGLRDAYDVPGLRVRHRGLDDAEVSAIETALPDDLRIALRRAVTELLQNTARHADVDEAEVAITRSPGMLQVRVSDRGRGFDGAIIPGRGLDRSVLQRAGAAGIDVGLDTAPGQGTTVTLRVPTAVVDSGPSGPAIVDDFRKATWTARRRAAVLYGGGLLAVGIVLAATSHPGELTPEYLMVAATAAVFVPAALTTRGDRVLSPYLLVLLPLSAVAAFGFSGWAVEFGRNAPVFWQAIGPTGPMILLVGLGRTRRPVIAGALAYALAVLVAAGLVGTASTSAAATTLMAGLAGLGLVFAWARFDTALTRIGLEAAQLQQAAYADRAEAAARSSATRARQRWRDAGLDRSIELLAAIAQGERDPNAPETRTACADEERYLRQLTLLDPDLVRLGHWLALALASAREHGVALVCRTGEDDLDEETARSVGTLLLGAITASTAGDDLTVTLFPTQATAQRLTMVGAHPTVTDQVHSWTAPADATVAVSPMGSTAIAEVDLLVR